MVTLRNTLDFNITLTPSGVELSENDTEPVVANATTTYSWNITDRVRSPLLFLSSIKSDQSDYGSSEHKTLQKMLMPRKEAWEFFVLLNDFLTFQNLRNLA